MEDEETNEPVFVWAVLHKIDYEGDTLECIYTDKDAALAYAARKNKKRGLMKGEFWHLDKIPLDVDNDDWPESPADWEE